MSTSHPPIAALPVRIGIRLLALSHLDEAEAARARLAGGGDGEALHDFRVALRRLRSCLRAYRPFFDDTLRGRDRRAVRELSAATGPARDIEVQLAWLGAEADLPPDAAAGARLLAQTLRRAKRPADRQALGAVHRLPALRTQLEPQLGRYSEEIDRRAPGRVVSCGAATAVLAGTALDGLEAALAGIGSAADGAAAIHAARIAGKRVRYLFEPFRDDAPGGPALLKRLRRFQDDLGRLHDFDLLLERARSEAGAQRAGSGAVAAFGALADHIEAVRATAFGGVAAAWLGRAAGELVESARAFADALRPAPKPRPDIEIERKYLLRSLPRLPAGTPVLRIDQGYLPGERLVERVRRVRAPDGTRYYRTVKLGRGISRVEVEEETDARTFRALWRLTKGRRIAKSRYVIAEGALKWEIDRFVGRRLVLAEIELPHESVEVKPPPWLERRIVREVTGEPEYLNVNLAG